MFTLNELFEFSDNLHSCLFDENAVEKRHLPSVEQRNLILQAFYSVYPEIKIKEIKQSDFLTLFKMLKLKKDRTFDENDIPSNSMLEYIFETFNFVIKQNRRQDDLLDVDDLAIIYILYNISLLRENSKLFWKKFNTEVIVDE